MELKDTVSAMLDECYKERFRAEYWQLKIRVEKLLLLITKYDEGTLDFKPSCSIGILRNQLDAMERYLQILKLRAKIEKIDLE